MHDVTEKQDHKVQHYYLKARVHDMPEGRYRGVVEFGVRTARGIDTKLHHCPLMRATWADAIDDAEKLAETLRVAECTDAECSVVSARGSTAFDTFMAMIATARAVNSPKLVSDNAVKRPAKRASAAKLAPVASEAKAGGVVQLRRHA